MCEEGRELREKTAVIRTGIEHSNHNTTNAVDYSHPNNSELHDVLYSYQNGKKGVWRIPSWREPRLSHPVNLKGIFNPLMALINSPHFTLGLSSACFCPIPLENRPASTEITGGGPFFPDIGQKEVTNEYI